MARPQVGVLPANPSSSAPGDAVSKGTAGHNSALDDHVHAREAFGSTAGTVTQGNDSRLSDSRAPNGSAGGDLAGTYPNPTIGAAKVTYAKIQNVSATDKLLGRSTAGAGSVEEIALTAAGRALIDDADATAQRTTLGLGTIATVSATAGGDLSGTYPNPAVVDDSHAHTAATVSGFLTGIAKYLSGKYYHTIIGNVANQPITLSKLVAVPLFLSASISMDQIAFVVNTAGTLSNVGRVGLYNDNGSGQPGTLIVDAGTVSTTTTGVKTVSINQTLGPGIIWVAYVSQVGTAASINAVALNGIFNSFLLYQTTPGSVVYGLSQAGITGALPSPWGATFTEETIGPICWIRKT